MSYAQQALALVQQNHMVAESWELYTNGMLDIPGDHIPVAGEVRPLQDFMDHPSLDFLKTPHLIKEADLAIPEPPHPRLSEALAVVARYHGEQLDEVIDLLAVKELDDVLPLTVLAEMIASRVKAIRTENAYVGFLPMPQLPKHTESLLDVSYGRKPELDKLGPFEYPAFTGDTINGDVFEPGIQPESYTVSQPRPFSARSAAEQDQMAKLINTGLYSSFPAVPAQGRGNPVILERMKEVVAMDRIQLVDDKAKGTVAVQSGLLSLARCWYEHCVAEKKTIREGHSKLHEQLVAAIVNHDARVLKQLEASGFEWGYHKVNRTALLNKGAHSLTVSVPHSLDLH